MPPRAAMEKAVQDEMNNIDEGRVLVAQMSRDKVNALRGIPIQQQPVVLQNAQTEYEHGEKHQAFLQEKARMEAEISLEHNQWIINAAKRRTIVQRELQQLKLEKKEPGLQEDEQDAISTLRTEFLQHPAMATAMFDTPFLQELKQQFDANFERLEQQFEKLQHENSEATRKAVDEVKEYISNGDFNTRLTRVFRILKDEQTRALNDFRESEGRLEKEKTDLLDKNAELLNDLDTLRLEKDDEIERLTADSINARTDQGATTRERSEHVQELERLYQLIGTLNSDIEVAQLESEGSSRKLRAAEEAHQKACEAHQKACEAHEVSKQADSALIKALKKKVQDLKQESTDPFTVVTHITSPIRNTSTPQKRPLEEISSPRRRPDYPKRARPTLQIPYTGEGEGEEADQQSDEESREGGTTFLSPTKSAGISPVRRSILGRPLTIVDQGPPRRVPVLVPQQPAYTLQPSLGERSDTRPTRSPRTIDSPTSSGRSRLSTLSGLSIPDRASSAAAVHGQAGRSQTTLAEPELGASDQAGSSAQAANLDPTDLNVATEEMQEIWRQIQLPDNWTIADSDLLLVKFQKARGRAGKKKKEKKKARNYWPQQGMDKIAADHAKKSYVDCLPQYIAKLKREWDAGKEDKPCHGCADVHSGPDVCVDVFFVEDDPGEYDSTNSGKRWRLVKRD